MRVRVGVVPAIIFAVFTLTGGWGRVGLVNFNPIGSFQSNPPTSQASSGTSGGGTSVSGICGNIDAGKSLVQNMRNLGSNPSLDSLISSLKKLDTKIAASEASAAANMKPGFAAVGTADNAVQKSISQLKSSGAPQSSYLQSLKAGIGGLATAYDQLVSLSKCA